ncbi:MAG: polysaccharide ABC transporter ATP-binding protein [Ginsengibacter sp.]
MKPILEVQHITKQFKIGSKQERYLSLRDVVANPFSKKKNNHKTFLALDDVSFGVYPGESIGIIGRNGAGKSTLLKILSRITPPTSGKIICRGRVASLLEVGTGFHPELTGRENIYMNGSILGMRKFEIDKHFDSIVDFSGVEKFIDTPLKHFSSGMQLRLAFAVAAFLEPEILVIDEVLAVGDAEFQKKCLGKMDEVSKSGRTVLFVSHNMGVIAELCRKGIILNQGKLLIQDNVDIVLDKYNTFLSSSLASYQNDFSGYDEPICISSVTMESRSGNNIFSFEEDIAVEIKIDIKSGFFEGINLGVALLDKWKRKVFTSHNKIKNPHKNEYNLIIPKEVFLTGGYSLDVSLFVPQGKVFQYLKDICPFDVSDFTSEMSQYANADTGIINLPCRWE